MYDGYLSFQTTSMIKNVAILQAGETKSYKRKPWWIWYDCNHDSELINKYKEW